MKNDDPYDEDPDQFLDDWIDEELGKKKPTHDLNSMSNNIDKKIQQQQEDEQERKNNSE